MKLPVVFISSSSQDLGFARKIQKELMPYANVMIWADEVFSSSVVPVKTLDDIASKVDLVIIINTGKENQNAIFETGYFVGKLGIDRILLVNLITNNNREFGLTEIAGMQYLQLHYHDNDMYLIEKLSNAVRNILNRIKIEIVEKPLYYSCFISHSHEDEEFALKLYDDLKEVGVQCWMAVNDLRIGKIWKEDINTAINSNEKLLLILSRNSIHSSSVHQEIKAAIKKEIHSNKTILYPIRLDDTIFEVKSLIPASLKEKQIADFKYWHDKKSYQRAFSGLLRDLMTSISHEIKNDQYA